MLLRTYQRRKRGASQGDGSQDSPWDSQESLLGSSQDSYEDDPDQPHSQSSQWNSNASEYACSLVGSKGNLDEDSQNSQGKSSAAAAAAAILMPPPSMRSRGKSKSSRSKEAANTGTAERTGLDRKRKADQTVATDGGNMQKILPAVRAATRADSAGDDSQSDRIGVQANISKDVSRIGTVKSGSKNAFSSWIDVPAGPLSTLTDAQDRGQMIEYIDEANFAMTGLSRGQAVRMIRASLVTMAQLCKSTESRRLLRNHGFHRPLLEAVLDLELGDPALSLGTAAILYFLAIDEGHDTDIWESKKCLQFLFRHLQMFSMLEDGVGGLPPPPPNAGGALGKKKGFFRPSKASDTGASTIEKLKELFRRQEHGEDGEDSVGQDGIGDKDISATRLALLTLQKACSSPIVLEEVGSGASGGRAAKNVEHLKERLREEGGLETVAELASQCLTQIKATAQEKTKSRGSSKGESLKGEPVADTTGMLLRCLRVMENVTFLNQSNQRHLIQLVVKRGIRGEPSRPFIAFLLDTIDTLSAVESTDAKPTRLFKGSRDSGSDISEGNHFDLEASRGVRMSVRDGCGAAIRDESGTATKSGRPKQLLGNGEEESEQALKGKSSQTIVSVFAKKKTVRNSTSMEDCPTSSGNTELHLSKMVEASQRNSAGNGHEGKKAGKDPFAFDEDSDTDNKPVGAVDRDSSGEHTASQPKCRDAPGDLNPLPLTPIKDRRDEDISNRGGERQLERMQFASPSPAYRAVGRPSGSADSMVHGVVENCLISAVKVLMNLSNENVYGCRQVALAGGLQTISALAVTCCKSVALSVGNGDGSIKSSFQFGISPSGDAKSKSRQCGNDDMDLLIVVLGVLVNLVEKNESNRTELASMECPLVEERRGKGRKVGMVPFLCALFASKQGASELHKEREEHGHEVEAEVNAEVNQKEAEAMMVEAHAALLLAFLSRAGANSYATMVQLLPGDGLEMLVPVLEHFFAFHQSLNAITPESYASAKALIESISNQNEQVLPYTVDPFLGVVDPVSR